MRRRAKTVWKGALAAAVFQDNQTPIAFWPTRPWLVTQGPGSGGTVVDFQTGDQVAVVGPPRPRAGSSEPRLAVSGHYGRTCAVSPTGRDLAFIDFEIFPGGCVRFWEPNEKQLLTKAIRTSEDIASIAYSPDGKTIAALVGNGDCHDIVLFDAESCRRYATLAHSRSTRHLVFSPDGRWLATHSAGDVLIWDVNSRQIIAVLTGAVGWSPCIAFSPDSQWFGAADGGVYLWSLAEIATDKIEAVDTKPPLVGHAHNAPVTDLHFAPASNTLYSVGQDGALNAWNLPGGDACWSQQEERLELARVTASSDGKQLIAAGARRGRGVIRFHDPQHGTLGREMTRPAGMVLALALAPGDRQLAFGTSEGEIAVYSMEDEGIQDTFQAKGAPIWSLDYSPDGRLLASAGWTRHVEFNDHTTLGHIRRNYRWETRSSPGNRLRRAVFS